MKKRYTYGIETQTDGWMSHFLLSSPLCSPQSSVMVRHPFSFLLYNVLWSWCDVYFLPRLYTRCSLCWLVTLNNLYCHYSLQNALQVLPVTTTTQIAQEVVVALIPPFLHLSCSLMHTCCSLCCCLSCVYVVAHHVICLHELCISYYLQLFNSSKLSWCLTASFYPPVFKVNCDTSQPNGREIRRLKVSALLSVDR